VAVLPEPRVIVFQDADHKPGLGAFVGALNCEGCATSGAVRDLPAVKAMGFQMHAHHTLASHAYAHIVAFCEPVEIGGLTISPRVLLFGDRVPRESPLLFTLPGRSIAL
jgi:hypothetical protein